MNRKPLTLSPSTTYRLGAYLNGAHHRLSVFGLSETSIISRSTEDAGNGWHRDTMTIATGDEPVSVFVKIPRNDECRFVQLTENP